VTTSGNTVVHFCGSQRACLPKRRAPCNVRSVPAAGFRFLLRARVTDAVFAFAAAGDVKLLNFLTVMLLSRCQGRMAKRTPCGRVEALCSTGKLPRTFRAFGNGFRAVVVDNILAQARVHDVRRLERVHHRLLASVRRASTQKVSDASPLCRTITSDGRVRCSPSKAAMRAICGRARKDLPFDNSLTQWRWHVGTSAARCRQRHRLCGVWRASFSGLGEFMPGMPILSRFQGVNGGSDPFAVLRCENGRRRARGNKRCQASGRNFRNLFRR